MNKYLVITSLGLLLFNTIDAQREKINKEDYSIEFKRDGTFIFYKKETITFPDGSTFTQRIPLEKLPDELRLEQESNQEFCKKIFTKYGLSSVIELAIIVALHITKQVVSEQSHPHYHLGFNVAESVALGKFSASMLALGYDLYLPPLKIEYNENSDEQQPAAQFFNNKS